MAELDALRNKGVLRLGTPPPKGKETTVVVLGVARSGTSMVASVLQRLGVFLGDQAVAPVFEDVRLATALESKDASAVAAIVREYDERHPMWAFKRPSAIDHVAQIERAFRKPVYLVVFRDLLGIANRNVLSMKSEAVRSMRQALSQYAKLLDFLDERAPSALLVSNEKALINPRVFVDELTDWLSLDVSPAQLESAVSDIVVDSPHYLQASRLHFLGNVDRATTQFVSGWAHVRGRKDHARVTILLDDKVIATAVADRARPDVHKKGVHPTGFCGFRYEFRPEDGAKAGSIVSVRFELGGEELRSSPCALVEPA
jgi:adenosyl cobinamide kinase/adenosyl cobinamide phosphate guanylyltransferase